ncbi:hypothetical protein GCM10020331_033950 [Ectobacillus funiculus]
MNIVHNHADYRLLSKRALDELSLYEERNVFFCAALFRFLAFVPLFVTYERKARFAGESKYPLKKCCLFAFDGITSFSITPIRWITIIGMCVFLLSLVCGVYALGQRFLGFTTPGWTSIVISIWLLGGIQLMSIGLIGEYIGKKCM